MKNKVIISNNKVLLKIPLNTDEETITKTNSHSENYYSEKYVIPCETESSKQIKSIDDPFTDAFVENSHMANASETKLEFVSESSEQSLHDTFVVYENPKIVKKLIYNSQSKTFQMNQDDVDEIDVCDTHCNEIINDEELDINNCFGIPVEPGTPTTGDFPPSGWIKKNIINPPPAIVFDPLHLPTSDFIYISWKYPTQINIGMLNIYLPYIHSFTFVVNACINDELKEYTIFDKSDVKTLRYTNTTLNTEYITGIILTNIQSEVGYKFVTFPDNVTRYAYIYYSPDFENIVNDIEKNKVTAYYSNYNINNNPSSTGYTVFINAGVPSAPGIPNQSGGQIFGNDYLIDMKIIGTPPLFPDKDNPNSVSKIKSYKVTLSTNGYLFRYDGPIAESREIIVSSTNDLSYDIDITNLYPDCTYDFIVTSQNNSLNQNFGDQSLVKSITTSGLPQISTFTNFNFTGHPVYSAKLVDSNSSENKNTLVTNIFLSNPATTSPFYSSYFDSPIHIYSTRGLMGSPLLKIICDLEKDFPSSQKIDPVIDTNKDTPLTYTGFPATKPNDSVTKNGSITIVPETPTDSYQNYPLATKGFYLQTKSRIALNPSLFSAIGNSNDKYTIVLKQYLNQNLIQSTTPKDNQQSYNFYYDNSSQAVSVTSFTISLNTVPPLFKVSGINVAYGNIKLSALTVVSNLGSYFYNSNKILSYSSGQSETGILNLQSGSIVNKKLNSSVTINNNGNPDILYTVSTYQKSLSISVTAYSVSGNTNTRQSNALPIVIDNPSYTLLTTNATNPSTIPLLGITSFVCGYRIWSDVVENNNYNKYVTKVPTTIAYKNIKYSHEWNINSNNNNGIDATQELQVFDGKYASKGTTTNGYFDYSTYYGNTLNYSSINSNNTYRYATFCWKIQEHNQNYTRLTVEMNELNGIKANTINADVIESTNSSKIYIFYRIEDSDHLNEYKITYKNSMWIDINRKTAPVLASANFFLYDDPIINNNILAGKNTSYSFINTYANQKLTLNGLFPSTRVESNENIHLYIRIALPMDANVSFKSICARLSSD